ncbi:MAG: TatD family hydrolase [Dehalococcoidia bacterium]|nr:TatD family hydrolase [Dehalococcoidia bacterium]
MDDDLGFWAALEALTRDPRCVAVGETGLDAHHDRVPMAIQETRFVRQLELAKQVGKPVIVHCREAEAACSRILRDHDPGTRGVLHCWAGGLELAKTALELGWCVSLAGNVTFKNASALRQAAAQIPLNRLLVETDSPFLAPHPHRGRTNRPAWTSLVARTLAEIQGVSYEQIVAATRHNTLELFQLSTKGS